MPAYGGEKGRNGARHDLANRQAADQLIGPYIAHDVCWHLQRDWYRRCDKWHRMTDRLCLLEVAVCLTSREAKLAR
jgi:hypothetical protein